MPMRDRLVPDHGRHRGARRIVSSPERSFRHQLSTHLFELHQHAGTLVDAEEAAGLEVVDAVGADDVLGRQHRVAERLAELRRARLRLRQRALGRIEEHQPAVERVSRERVAGRRVVGLLVHLAVGERHLLRRIAVRQLLGNDHGTGRSDHALDRPPADADEIRIDQRMGAVEPALVAAFRQRKVGQRARRAGAAGDDRVGTRRDDLERLTGDGRVGAGIAFVGDDFDRRSRRRSSSARHRRDRPRNC